MTDPSTGRQPSEEELRAYLEQLRDADVAQVVVQAYQVLGTGAEVKLGRPDARALIDAMSALVGAVDGHVDAKLAGQMADGVRQLQMAQVQAEQGGGAEQPTGEQAPDDRAGEPAEPGQPTAGEEQRLTDRLWVPGRPGPPPKAG